MVHIHYHRNLILNTSVRKCNLLTNLVYTQVSSLL